MNPLRVSRLPILTALLLGALASTPTNAGCGCTIAYGSGWEEGVRCCDPSLPTGTCEVVQSYPGQTPQRFYVLQSEGDQRCAGIQAEVW